MNYKLRIENETDANKRKNLIKGFVSEVTKKIEMTDENSQEYQALYNELNYLKEELKKSTEEALKIISRLS